MKISYNWLKQYIDIDLPVREMSKILTDIGLEVEGIEEFENVKGGLAGFVIGEVLSCSKHPNADKLSLTEVMVGNNTLLSIVCGAPNVAAGQKVVVATVGTTIFSGEDSFKIKKTKIRGEVSEGMICAEDELGLGDNHDGIIVLPKDTPVGLPAKDYFKIESDTVFEIGLTPNRIDAASHYGVARDLAAYFNQTKRTELKFPDTSGFKTENHNLPYKVKIENHDACKRYTGVTISDVEIKPSPEWMQTTLKAIGLNPINNVVDITNYVLYELGQPLHAFDADILEGREIIVKSMPQGTKFTTLDEKEHTLEANDLLICDVQKPVALGGIFGGLHSGVNEKTKNIFLESAYFNPVTTRKTAKRLGISTDSSFRFERGVDPNITIKALKRAALLIKELAGGTISCDIIDVYPEPISHHQVVISFKHIDSLIGESIDRQKIKTILESLEIAIQKETPDSLQLIVPAYRVDVTREADVIEDILRIYGYNNIDFSHKLQASILPTEKPDNEKLMNVITDYLAANGFYEIMNNSLTRESYYKSIQKYPKENLVHLINPISSDLGVMRQTLFFGGLETIQYNTNRQYADLRLFEMGSCYHYSAQASNSNPLDNYTEERNLALFITGKKHEQSWILPEQDSSFYELKGYVENVLQKIGIDLNQAKTTEIGEKSLFAAGLEISLNKKTIAELGIVNQNICKRFDIDKEVYFAEIYWETALTIAGETEVRFIELPKFPEVRRDLSMLLDNNTSFKQIKDIATKVENKLLQQVNLFDVYEGKNIPVGKKSYAVSFILQDREKTLTDQQIDKVMDKIASAYQRELNAEIRK